MKEHAEELHSEFDVEELLLFGSHARGEAHLGSDIDLMVKFRHTPTFDGYMNLKFHLEKLLCTRVDLVTRDALKPRMRPVVEREAIHVA